MRLIDYNMLNYSRILIFINSGEYKYKNKRLD